MFPQKRASQGLTVGDIVPEKVFECINQYFVTPDVRKIPNKLTFSCHQKSMRTVDVGTFF